MRKPRFQSLRRIDPEPGPFRSETGTEMTLQLKLRLKGWGCWLHLQFNAEHRITT